MTDEVQRLLADYYAALVAMYKAERAEQAMQQLSAQQNHRGEAFGQLAALHKEAVKTDKAATAKQMAIMAYARKEANQ